MSAVITALIQVSITSIIIFLAILLFRAAARNSISAKLQYAIWLLLIARLVIPVSFELPAAVGAALPVGGYIAQAASGATAQSGAAAVQSGMSAAQTVQICVLAVWVAGIIAVGVWTALSKRAYNRRVLQTAVYGDAGLRELLAQCRAELGIKRDIELIVVSEAASPALTLMRSAPVLILPETLKDKREQRYAILHELTHYRRKDHLMLGLMGILRCIWWFDPVCWLAFPQIQSDMETACDAEVMARLSCEEKRSYLVTILRMFTYKTQPILGMAQSKSKKLALRRMRGAFMKSKTKTFATIAAACICMLLTVCCFTTGCAAGYEVVEVSEAVPADMISADEAAKLVAGTVKADYGEDLAGCTMYVSYLATTMDSVTIRNKLGDYESLYFTGIDWNEDQRVVTVQRDGQTSYVYLLNGTNGAVTEGGAWEE